MSRRIVQFTRRTETAAPLAATGPLGRQVQRKCDCGGSPGWTGECAQCKAKRRRGLQPKLAVNKPGDKYELEADRVAEQVMKMPEPGPKSARQASSPPLARRLASIVSCGSTRYAVGANLLPLPTFHVWSKASETSELFATSPRVITDRALRIHALRGVGKLLPAAVRAFFEPRLGYDFSRVRVHTDTNAAETARAVSARAFAVGSNIVFGAGQYAPGTTEGLRLLAHELTHVVQQTHGPPVSVRLQRSEGEKVAAPSAPAKTSGIVSIDLTRLREVLDDWESALAKQNVPSPFVLEEVEGTAFHRITIQESERSAIEKEVKRVDSAADDAAKGTLGADRRYPQWALRVAAMALSDIPFDLSFVAADAALIPRIEGDKTKRVSMDNPSGDPPALASAMARVKEAGRQADRDRLAGNVNAVEEAQEQFAEQGLTSGPKSVGAAGVTVATKALADQALQKTLKLLMQEYDKAFAEAKIKAEETDQVGADFRTDHPWAQKTREQARAELAKLLEEQRSKHVEAGAQKAVQVFIDQRVGREGRGGPVADPISKSSVDLGELVAHELAIHGVAYLPGSSATRLVPIADEVFISRNLDTVQQAAYEKVQRDHGIGDVYGQHHWFLVWDLEFEPPKDDPSKPEAE